jgi:hypothetical protein
MREAAIMRAIWIAYALTSLSMTFLSFHRSRFSR